MSPTEGGAAGDKRLPASPKHGDVHAARRPNLAASTICSIILRSNDDPDDCFVCRGSAEPGWTCEDHPGKPWRHSGCRGAGAPCACNPRGAALWALVYSDALRVAEAPGFGWRRSIGQGVRREALKAGGLETSLG